MRLVLTFFLSIVAVYELPTANPCAIRSSLNLDASSLSILAGFQSLFVDEAESLGCSWRSCLLAIEAGNNTHRIIELQCKTEVAIAVGILLTAGIDTWNQTVLHPNGTLTHLSQSLPSATEFTTESSRIPQFSALKWAAPVTDGNLYISMTYNVGENEDTQYVRILPPYRLPSAVSCPDLSGLSAHRILLTVPVSSAETEIFGCKVENLNCLVVVFPAGDTAKVELQCETDLTMAIEIQEASQLNRTVLYPNGSLTYLRNGSLSEVEFTTESARYNRLSALNSDIPVQNGWINVGVFLSSADSTVFQDFIRLSVIYSLPPATLCGSTLSPLQHFKTLLNIGAKTELVLGCDFNFSSTRCIIAVTTHVELQCETDFPVALGIFPTFPYNWTTGMDGMNQTVLLPNGSIEYFYEGMATSSVYTSESARVDNLSAVKWKAPTRNGSFDVAVALWDQMDSIITKHTHRSIVPMTFKSTTSSTSTTTTTSRPTSTRRVISTSEETTTTTITWIWTPKAKAKASKKASTAVIVVVVIVLLLAFVFVVIPYARMEIKRTRGDRHIVPPETVLPFALPTQDEAATRFKTRRLEVTGETSVVPEYGSRKSGKTIRKKKKAVLPDLAD